MKKRYIEYSKLVTGCMLCVLVAVLGFSCWMIWDTRDTGALEWLIGGAFTTIAAIVGFYLWRAKAKDKIQMYKNDPEAFRAAGIGNNEEDEEEIGG